MAKRRPYIQFALFAGICLALAGTATPAHAQQIRDGQFIEIWPDSSRTGLFHKSTINVDTLGLWLAVQRRIDSTVNASGSAVNQSEIHVLMTINFSNNANDSANFAVPAGYQMYPLPYDMYMDRFILNTNAPSATGPSTFRTDLPPVSTDSSFLFRISRNASFPATQKAGIGVYKIAKGQGLAVAVTAGVQYDMIRFDEAVLGSAGTSRQVLVNFVMKKLR